MMTNDEAIDLLKESIEVINDYVICVEEYQECESAIKEAKKRIDCYNHAIRSLDKQVKKKPKNIVDDVDVDVKVCPCCESLAFEDSNFCDKCGQALDWSGL